MPRTLLKPALLFAAFAASVAAGQLIAGPGHAQSPAPSTWQMAASPEARGPDANSVLWLLQHGGSGSTLYLCKSQGGGFANEPPSAKCARVALPG